MRRADGLSCTADGTLVAVSGIGGAAAALAARALADAGVGALVSWGMAGGLDPTLPSGAVCLPSTVISADGASFPTDSHWRELIGAAIGPRRTVVYGKLLTSDHAIENIAGKAAAFRATGATAVDMESVSIAQMAASHGLPFIAIRVIVDTAGDRLPDAVLAASREGQVRIWRLVLGLLRSPRDMAPLLRLARRYGAARRALTAVARSGVLAPLAFTAASATRIA